MSNETKDAGLQVHLPPELVHKILRLSAASSARTAANVCLVAKGARELVLPQLYRVCEMNGRDSQPGVIWQNIDIGKHVKALWKSDIHNHRSVARVLNACPNLKHIALRFDDVYHLLKLEHQTAPSLNLSKQFVEQPPNLQLAIVNRCYLGLLMPNVHQPSMHLMMSRVTHLSLPALAYHGLDIYKHFRAVTHLALLYPGPLFKPDLLQLARDTPYLQQIVLLVELDTPLTSQDTLPVILDVFYLRSQDLRFWLLHVEVTAGVEGRSTWIGERRAFRMIWEEGVRGGRTMWELAEKQTKEIHTQIQALVPGFQ